MHLRFINHKERELNIFGFSQLTYEHEHLHLSTRNEHIHKSQEVQGAAA